MFGLGIAALTIGALLALAGFLGDTSVASPSGNFGGVSRVHNLGLLNQQAGLITLGTSLMIVGSVFVSASLVIQKVADLSHELRSALSRPASQPVSDVPSTAPVRTSHALPTTVPVRKGVANELVYPPEAWDEVEANAIAKGWTTNRIGQNLRLRDASGNIRSFGSLPLARTFLGLPPIDPPNSKPI